MKIQNPVNKWFDLPWQDCYRKVENLQNNILVAYQKGDMGKVKQLQHNLVHSYETRALAVRIVTTNKGKETPGVDKVAKLTPKEKAQLVIDLLNHRKVDSKPVRRVWLSKDGNPVKADRSNAHPLGIPCIYDRAAQSLWAIALAPIAEHWGDRHSYGYRPKRSTQDAIIALFLMLGTRNRPVWVLEADIKGFFDNITHDWIMDNIPIDKSVLFKWLKAGYIDNHQKFDTEGGVPQGGPISPIIANIVLDGLSEHVLKAVKPFAKKGASPKVLVVRYADDFVITGKSKEMLETVVTEAVNEFLKRRGLWLNPKKTVITHLQDGFHFLGFNFRIYPRESHPTGFGLLVKPIKAKVIDFKRRLRKVFREGKNMTAYALIQKRNPILRGWANYYRTVTSKKIFSSMDKYLWNSSFKWIRRKHRKLGVKELLKLYFHKVGNRDKVFYGKLKGEEITLFSLAYVQIKRHSIVANLNPYLLENKEYFNMRTHNLNKGAWDKSRWVLLRKTMSICGVCNQPISVDAAIDKHHIIAKKDGGSDSARNLLALHRECHLHITHTKDPNLRARYAQLGLIKI